MLILEDINAYSPTWNPHCQARKNSGSLKKLCENSELIVNNNPDYTTRSASHGGISIIDLVFSSSKLEPLFLWKIRKECPSLSDYNQILLE